MKNKKYSLTKMLNEIQLKQNRQLNRLKGYAFLNEFAIKKILTSGLLNEFESFVVSGYLKYNKITVINESVIKSVNRQQKLISEGRLDEGFTDFIKKSWDAATDKVTDIGSQVKDAFVKGWDGVKKIWSNFSDMIMEIVNKLKAGFAKVMNSIKAQVSGIGDKLIKTMDAAWIKAFKEKHPHKHEDAKKDFNDSKSIFDHITSFFNKNLSGGAFFEKKLVSGEFTPSETDGISGEEVEQSMEDIAEAYKSIFSNRQYIKELMTINEADITSVLIKNPMGRKVADYIILGIKAIFFPLTTLMEVVGEQVAEKILPMASKVSAKLGGPGPFEFPILSYIVLESWQIWAYGIKGTFSFEAITDLIAPFLAPFADAFLSIVKIAHAIVLAWAIIAVIQHIRSFFDENFGKETSESYTPVGKFKIKDGNLLYLKR
jgi:hypothetical protein